VRVRVRDLEKLDERLSARPAVSFFIEGSSTND